MHRKRVLAFTLIELLVVVTIIVVLLALLTPALDRAIYSAEMAVCGTQARGIAVSVQTYAVAQKRFYPYRPGVELGFWSPNILYDGANSNPTARQDDRLPIEGHLDFKLLICPFDKPIDISRQRTDPMSHVYASYSLWYGWRYLEARGGQGMKKLGDRIVWDGQSFNVLATDWDRINKKDNQSMGSHPDHEGKMSPLVRQDEPAISVALGLGAIKQAISCWNLPGSFERGPIDFNAAFADGSVGRYDRVRWDSAEGGDGVMVKVPEFNTGTYFDEGWWHNLPAR
jgi:hypothetical protein